MTRRTKQQDGTFICIFTRRNIYYGVALFKSMETKFIEPVVRAGFECAVMGKAS